MDYKYGNKINMGIRYWLKGHSRYKGGNSGTLVTPILAARPKGIIKPSLRVRENLGLVWEVAVL